MEKKLMKFLKKHKAWKKFKHNTTKGAWRDVDNIIKNKKPNAYIGGAFDWESSLEGYQFWDDVDIMWLQELCNEC